MCFAILLKLLELSLTIAWLTSSCLVEPTKKIKQPKLAFFFFLNRPPQTLACADTMKIILYVYCMEIYSWSEP